MKRTTGPRAIAASCAAIAMLAVAGCGGDDDSASSSSNDTTTTTEATTTTTTSSSSGKSYSSKAFVVPLTVSVDPSIEGTPTDTQNLLTWDGVRPNGATPDPSANAIRFLVPVDVFRPGSTTREAPPKEYLPYLLDQANHGATITDVKDITVDDHPAKLMTLTRNDDRPENDLHGSLGCLARGPDPRDGCFGIEPDHILRLAAIDMGDTTLLTWARVNKDNPDEAFVDTFEEMLKTVQFR